MPKKSSLIIIGGIAWILCVQYFIIELFVASAWKNPLYSFRNNYISDLGATACPYLAPFTNVPVCSPLAAVMNLSFIANGVLIIIGSFALSMFLARTKLVKGSLRLLALGSLGLIGVGLFPENTNMAVHTSMAIGFFFLSNTALIALGLRMREAGHTLFALYTLISGIVGAAAFIAFAFGASAIIGTGILERVIGDPLTIWLVVAGVYVLYNRERLQGI